MMWRQSTNLMKEISCKESTGILCGSALDNVNDVFLLNNSVFFFSPTLPSIISSWKELPMDLSMFLTRIRIDSIYLPKKTIVTKSYLLVLIRKRKGSQCWQWEKECQHSEQVYWQRILFIFRFQKYAMTQMLLLRIGILFYYTRWSSVELSMYSDENTD